MFDSRDEKSAQHFFDLCHFQIFSVFLKTWNELFQFDWSGFC